MKALAEPRSSMRLPSIFLPPSSSLVLINYSSSCLVSSLWTLLHPPSSPLSSVGSFMCFRLELHAVVYCRPLSLPLFKGVEAPARLGLEWRLPKRRCRYLAAPRRAGVASRPRPAGRGEKGAAGSRGLRRLVPNLRSYDALIGAGRAAGRWEMARIPRYAPDARSKSQEILGLSPSVVVSSGEFP